MRAGVQRISTREFSLSCHWPFRAGSVRIGCTSLAGRALHQACLVGYRTGLEEYLEQSPLDSPSAYILLLTSTLISGLRPSLPTHRLSGTHPSDELLSCYSPNLTEEG